MKTWAQLVMASLVGSCTFYPDPTPADTAGVQDGDAALLFRPDVVVPGSQGLPDESRQPQPHAPTLGKDPAPRNVRVGWPGRDTSRCLSVVWSTDVDTLASRVQLREADAEDVTDIEGVSFTYGLGLAYRVHEWKTCSDLAPSTAYQYRVGGDGAWSAWYDYATPAAPGSFDTFTVAMAGNSRGGNEEWGQLVQKMEQHDPDFYMFSGDMVEFGTNQGEWIDWLNATGDVFAEKVLVPAHGNHEYLAANYFALFSLPHNESWFGVDYGDLTVASLNDSFVPQEQMAVDEVALMDEVFGASLGRWKVAMHHRSIYSICDRHGSAEGLREIWEPAYDRHNVDFVVAGHNHIYERSVPIRNGTAAPAGEGTLYLVTGGAGAPIYNDFKPEWFNEVVNPTKHYVIAEFGPEGVTLTARDMSDTVIDSVMIPR